MIGDATAEESRVVVPPITSVEWLLARETKVSEQEIWELGERFGDWRTLADVEFVFTVVELRVMTAGRDRVL